MRIGEAAVGRETLENGIGIADCLTKLAIFYDREALRCAKARAYFAAAVLQAAALEAMLHSMWPLFPEQVKKTTVHKGWKLKTKRNRFLKFKFAHLIKIAKELKWFPPEHLFEQLAIVWPALPAVLASLPCSEVGTVHLVFAN